MHMADALLSPAVGAAFWAATAGTIACASRRVKNDLDDRKVPLMGVMGAFIFAAQMINFTIPGTGSSGHLGGGLLLAVLLGPSAAFLTLASVLTVQALFFADGGLLALGSNIFNLGFFPCYLAYPLIYRRIAGRTPRPWQIFVGSLLAATAGLQLGALAVVLQTTLSGISELPFRAFLLLMQPIHLAIGIVEGLVTAAVVTSIRKARPELLEGAAPAPGRLRPVLLGLALAAALTGGVLSWFASSRPDGLEWAIGHVAGKEELAPGGSAIHVSLAGVQEKTAVLPDYSLPSSSAAAGEGAPGAGFPVDGGTSLSGLIGGFLTLLFAALAGFVLRRRARTRRA